MSGQLTIIIKQVQVPVLPIVAIAGVVTAVIISVIMLRRRKTKVKKQYD